MSMMPGVTYFPCASIVTTASAGVATFAPTATILPSRSRIDPLRITGPAAVRIVALRISVARDGNGAYVDGYGSANGTDSAPGPGVGPAGGAGDAAVDGVDCCANPCWGSMTQTTVQTAASARANRTISAFDRRTSSAPPAAVPRALRGEHPATSSAKGGRWPFNRRSPFATSNPRPRWSA